MARVIIKGFIVERTVRQRIIEIKTIIIKKIINISNFINLMLRRNKKALGVVVVIILIIILKKCSKVSRKINLF